MTLDSNWKRWPMRKNTPVRLRRRNSSVSTVAEIVSGKAMSDDDAKRARMSATVPGTTYP